MNKTTIFIAVLFCTLSFITTAQIGVPDDFVLRLSYNEDIRVNWLVEDYDQLTNVDLANTREKRKNRDVDIFEDADFRRTTIYNHQSSNAPDWLGQAATTVLSSEGVTVYDSKKRISYQNFDIVRKTDLFKTSRKISFIDKIAFPTFNSGQIDKLIGTINIDDTKVEIDVSSDGNVVTFMFDSGAYFIVDNAQKQTIAYDVADGKAFSRIIDFKPVYPQCSESVIWLPGVIVETQDVFLPSGVCAKQRSIYNRTNIDFEGDYVCERSQASNSFRIKNIFSISPNPASERISIKTSENLNDESVNFRLLDLNGKELLKHRFNSPSHELILKNIPSGIYLLDINLGDIRQVEKLIVNK